MNSGAASLFTLEEFTPLDAALAKLQQAASPDFGIVRIAELARFSDEANLPYLYAEVQAGFHAAEDGVTRLAHADGGDPLIRGGGRYADRDRALAAAIGEALERYSASWLSADDLIFDSYRGLGDTAVAPDELVFYSPEQLGQDGFPYEPLREDHTIWWIPGIALPDLTPIWAPAQLITYHTPEFRTFSPDEPRLAHVTSNGLACAPTLTEAALSALFELLERDAAMITWYNRLSLPRLDWESDQQCRAIYNDVFGITGFDCVTVDLSCFHEIPTLLSVARGSFDALSPVTVGGAAKPEARSAWEKALTEATHSLSWIRDIPQTTLDRMKDATASDVQSFSDRIAFYAYNHHVGAASFLDSSPESVPLAALPELPSTGPGGLLQLVSARLRERGIRTYLFDLTAPDVRELGVHVVRAFAPALVPLNPDERTPFLGVPRMRSEPARLGLDANGFPNTWPHPYP